MTKDDELGHFVHEENIRRYRRLLERVSDEQERERILNLLAEAEKVAQSAADDRQNSK